MTMTPVVRKLALTLHITSSVGWIGVVIAYLALVTTAWVTDDIQIVRATWIAMEVIGWNVIVPLAVAALFTGLIMSLGTKWGLFRHYWVVISLLLTLIATLILVEHMQTVSFYAELIRNTESATRVGLESEFLHAGVGLIVLIVIQVLNVYKPRGMTPYGWRKQQEKLISR